MPLRSHSDPTADKAIRNVSKMEQEKAREKKKIHHYNLVIEDDIWWRLGRAKSESGDTIHEVIKKAILAYLDQNF